MSFDEIPENQTEGYPCDCGGSITKYEDKWICNSCDFERPVRNITIKSSRHKLRAAQNDVILLEVRKENNENNGKDYS